MGRFISREKAHKAQRAERYGPGALCFWVLTCLYGGSAAGQPSSPDLLAAPSLPPYRWFASTDPQHKNEDYLLLKPGETRRIPLAAGRLERLWGTASQPDKIALTLHNGKPFGLVRDGRAKIGRLAGKAYVFYPALDDPHRRLFETLQNGAALMVTSRASEPVKFYYQATVRNSGNLLKRRVGQLESDAKKSLELAPGSAQVLERMRGRGILEEITLIINPATSQTLQDIRLHAKWGGKLAVDVPLLAFTGQFFSLRSIHSDICSFDGKTLRLRWPIPFDTIHKPGGELSLLNTGRTKIHIQARLSYRASLEDLNVPAYRFCAAYGSARTRKGQPVQMLNVTGEGAFAGLALGIEPGPDTAARTFAYLEGNETITADGQKYEGTGTEDFFNSAWYFPDTPFAFPYHGMTFKSPLPPRVSAYRLMLPDAVPFKESLRFEFEHGSGNNRDGLLYRWVAFWYQKPPLTYQVSDELKGEVAASAGGQSSTSAPPSWGKRLLFAALGLILFVLSIRAVRRIWRRPSA